MNYFICVPLVVSIVLVLLPVAVVEANELRLFRNPEPHVEQHVEQHGEKTPSNLTKNVQEKVADTLEIDSGQSAYRYDGFVFSDIGEEFIVNGKPLSFLTELELNKVINAGQAIEIQTERGERFLIEIGKTVYLDSSEQGLSGAISSIQESLIQDELIQESSVQVSSEPKSSLLESSLLESLTVNRP